MLRSMGHKELDVTERLNDNNKGGLVGRHWHCSHISCLSTPRARPGPRSCLAAGRVTLTGQFAGEVMRLVSRRTPWERQQPLLRSLCHSNWQRSRRRLPRQPDLTAHSKATVGPFGAC